MSNKYLEPYAKENNLLQLSLFYFGKSVPKETKVEWKDDKGSYKLSCNCSKGVPGAFEQDVFTAAMRIWVKRKMPNEPIEVTYSDLARELNICPRSWNGRIKKALEKLGQARYLFDECFIVSNEGGREQISTHFSLFDYAILFNRDKETKGKKRFKSKLALADLIRKNLESNYYQYLDMAWYRALPSGLPRRLYEFLEKKRHLAKNNIFVIREENICRWLPIIRKNTTHRRSTLAKTGNSLIESGYLKAYFFDKKKKLCFFSYSDAGTSPIIEEEKEEVIEIVPEKILVKKTSPLKKEPKAIPESTELERLVSLLRIKRVPKATKNILAKHLNEEGAAYVERNILYANDKARSSYSNYLGKCLENDYAEAWSEEKEQKQDTLFNLNEELKKKEEQEAEKKRIELGLEQLRLEFLKKVSTLGNPFLIMAMDSAEKEVENSPAKSFAIKPAYAKKLLYIVNSMGGSFPDEVLTMDLMKKLWAEKEGV